MSAVLVRIDQIPLAPTDLQHKRLWIFLGSVFFVEQQETS